MKCWFCQSYVCGEDKSSPKIGKEFWQSQKWEIWKMMFPSKASNNQVVEPIQGNNLTQTSQHSPAEVQDHKTQGFSPEKNPLSSHSPSQGATNYTSLKLAAKAQGNTKKHPKKKRIVFKVSISKVSTVSGYISSHFFPGSNLPSCNKHSPKILAQHWPDASVALLAMAKSQNIWMLCCHQPMASKRWQFI